jgi:Carboxypeptidase regulatory-like domain
MKRSDMIKACTTNLVIVSIAAAGIGLIAQVRAGGMPDEEADQQLPSRAIVGFVKDPDGNVVPEARVVATFKAGNTDLITRSDATGHFRIPGFSKTATADSIEVSCSKDGYKQTASLKRRPLVASDAAPIEVDCVLTHL